MRRVVLITALLAVGCASPAAAGFGFQVDDGNIGCLIGKVGVRCDISQREWNPPPAPSSCPVDYGQGLTLAKHGRGSFVCAGDTVLGIGPTFGDQEKVVRRGRFRCESEADVVRCVNKRTDHGFETSRERARRF